MTAGRESGSPFTPPIADELVRQSKVYSNLGQEFIMTTEDKLRLCLRDHADCLASKERWVAPVSLFFTFLIVFATADFHEALGLSKATWQAVFVLCTFASVIWSLWTIVAALRTRRSIDDLIRALKQGSPAPSPGGAASNNRMNPQAGGGLASD